MNGIEDTAGLLCQYDRLAQRLKLMLCRAIEEETELSNLTRFPDSGQEIAEQNKKYVEYLLRGLDQLQREIDRTFLAYANPTRAEQQFYEKFQSETQRVQVVVTETKDILAKIPYPSKKMVATSTVGIAQFRAALLAEWRHVGTPEFNQEPRAIWFIHNHTQAATCLNYRDNDNYNLKPYIDSISDITRCGDAWDALAVLSESTLSNLLEDATYIIYGPRGYLIKKREKVLKMLSHTFPKCNAKSGGHG